MPNHLYGTLIEGTNITAATVKHYHETCEMEEQPSNRAVEALLSRLGYNRHRGRIKTPPLDADRLARIPQFLVQMEPKAPTS